MQPLKHLPSYMTTAGQPSKTRKAMRTSSKPSRISRRMPPSRKISNPKKEQRRGGDTRLSKARVAAIAKQIEHGEISLPDVDAPSDTDYVATRALLDSGSSVHGCNAKTVFRGSVNEPPPRGAKGFQTADGTNTRHKSFATVHCRTPERDTRPSIWKHADVSMPIISTHELAGNNHHVEYVEHEGFIRRKPSGRTTGFIPKAGVYFIKWFVSKHATVQPKCDASLGVGRQG